MTIYLDQQVYFLHVNMPVNVNMHSFPNMHVEKKSHVDKVYRADDVEHERHAQDPQLHANTLQLLTPAGMPIRFTSAASVPQLSSKPPHCLPFKLRRLIRWW